MKFFPSIQWSVICNLQSATCVLQPATCNLQPATCNLKSANCNLKPAICILFFLFSLLSFSQVTDSTKTVKLDEVVVASTRVDSKTPMPFTNISKTEIAKRNLGQDIPSLINFLPSVVSTSDAGNGFGYSGFRVRGSDLTRINVTINGIPYNDSESQNTYFVDLPDFASSLQSVQLQRGVGTSTNGSGAFGASLNLLTDNYSDKINGEFSNSIGSFNSYKNTLKFSSGLINKHFEISGRLSNIQSDGFVERAKSDLKSYFFQTNYINKNSLIKALFFGGKEKTYQAWNGVDKDKLYNDRTYNSAGLYYDENGEEKFYDNQIDNYNQHHFQLHWTEKWTEKWNSNLAFHFTKGKGFFENYIQTKQPQIYGLFISVPMPGIPIIDLINQNWLDNDFFGTSFSANYKNEKADFTFGSSINKYEGKHFDKTIWAKNATIVVPDGFYFDDFATKIDGTVFVKMNYKIKDKLYLFADLQLRKVEYKNNSVSENYLFFNPKTGISYEITNNQLLYFSYAKANREPNRTDFENGNPVSEALDDYELGFRFNKNKTQFNINGYFMNYKNQLVLTGALDNVGNAIRANIGKSYRLGIEFDSSFQVSEKVKINPNFTISKNKNLDFNYSKNNIDYNGNTNIAYSPEIIAGNILQYNPIKKFGISFLSKFVGEQFLSNKEDDNAKLNDYFTQDLHFQYDLKLNKKINSINFKLLINNVLDKQYESNGADYGDGFVVYFPQAGINFLFGVDLKF